MGRPKAGDEIKTITAIAEKVFAGHGDLRDVALYCGVSHETIRQWMIKGEAGDERYKDFAERCNKALTVAKMRTWKKAEDRDPRWTLVVRHGVKDAPSRHEISGPDGKPIETKAQNTMTREELIALALQLHDE